VKEFDEREKKLEQRIKAQISIDVDAIVRARLKKP
jgi:hypothetical protein